MNMSPGFLNDVAPRGPQNTMVLLLQVTEGGELQEVAAAVVGAEVACLDITPVGESLKGGSTLVGECLKGGAHL